MKEAINQYFVRPQRQTYYSFDLGPHIMTVSNHRCIRLDFEIINLFNHKLMVSFYQFQQYRFQNCVIYLHTHHGSKLEALPLVDDILRLGLNLCIFDFAGYGNSTGDSVGLGSKEIWDIECVIQHLHQKFNQCHFILWGRSMGAVAALLYLHMKQSKQNLNISQNIQVNKINRVVAGIYDSPFYSLEKLTLEITSKTSNIPQFLLKPFVYYIKSTLKDQINFQHLELLDKMQKIRVPGIFLTSKQDQFIKNQHSQLLYEKYSGNKQLIYIEKDHNQARKTHDLIEIYSFIKRINDQFAKRWENVLLNNLKTIKSQENADYFK